MKKSTLLSYLFTVCVMLFCFSAVYYFNYSRMKREMETQDETRQQRDDESFGYVNDPGDESKALPERQGDDESAETDIYRSENNVAAHPDSSRGESTEDDLLEADGSAAVRTNPSMVFVVGQYDWITGIVTETVGKFPEELLGLTRQELLVYLREHPEYGTLLSFSEHAVYLRKSDEEDWADYTYYLILEDEGLMVYYLDQTTLYLDTGISPEELSDEDRELLESGFYIKDTAGLFDYLQTVTS